MTELPLVGHEFSPVRNVRQRKGTFKSGKVARARPVIPPEDKLCLITYTKINGQDAWTLWDAGSTTTSITPSFADVANINAFPLLDPFMVQLGTVGSRAKITHGADVKVSMPGFNDSIYVDICNLDRYDLVIGTPFMRRNGVVLDFERNVITINGTDIPALPYPNDIDPRLHRTRATIELTEDDIPQLREHWRREYDDMVNGTPSKLPPFREVNHEIHLIDENRVYTYHTPRCPNALRTQFYEKLNRYVTSGWWTASSTAQAAPLMCIPK
ncbi:hypothetical protein BDN70DRAFT_798505, partial [Pholiota conissans]